MKDINQSVKDLWMQGLTGTQIGKELNITRSAVLGKIYRMREAGQIDVRESDVQAQKARETTKKIKDGILNGDEEDAQDAPPKRGFLCEPVQPLESFPPHPFLFEELPPNDPQWKPVTFDNLTPRSCRYVLNDGNPSTFLFCGKQKKGRAYCEEHEKLCYYYLTRRTKNK